MRLLTLLALAVVAAGVYHYRQRRGFHRPAEHRQGISDFLLAERVRAGIACAGSSPVDVRVVHGIVSLHGTVRKPERDLVLAAALAVRGVTQVPNSLEPEEPVGDIGTMQAGIATGV